MKQFLSLLLAMGTLTIPVRAQENSASAIADKQLSEERYKTITADMESLLAANLSLQKKVSALETELQKVREDQTRSTATDTTKERLRKVEEAIDELVKARASDKQKILDAIAKMERSITAAAAPIRTPAKAPVVPETNAGPEKGFPRAIQSGDTLSGIVASYNAAFKAKGMKTITQKQVMEANPNVNWSKLRVGQKIFVPAPSE